MCGDFQAKRWLTSLLAAVLVLPPNLFAQQAAVPQVPDSLPVMQTLKILPLAGNRGMNDLEKRIMTPLVVQILDQNSRPVEGATVVFRFPIKGPSAEFPNRQATQSVRSNADGQAAATGWMANREVGGFQVHVTASRANELGETTISMSNVTRIVADAPDKHKNWWSSKWVKIGVVAGAAGVVAAIVLVTRGGSSNTTITASPGSPTIGVPH